MGSLRPKGRVTPYKAVCSRRAVGGREQGRGKERIKPPTFPLQQQLLQKAPLGSTFSVLDQIPESAQSI